MKVSIEHLGVTYSAEAQFVAGKLWVHFQGRTFLYENEQQKNLKRKKTSLGTGVIHSPMPGKITKIIKNVGDAVQIGDSVLVMEAMKMEYTLKAEVNGSIKSIDCKTGDQVVLGKKLIEILPEKAQ